MLGFRATIVKHLEMLMPQGRIANLMASVVVRAFAKLRFVVRSGS
jgi:hypothetical protein